MRSTKTLVSQPIRKVTRAIEILLSEGLGVLSHQVKQTINALVRGELQRAAFREIDHIATSSMSSAEKFSKIYQKQLWFRVMAQLNPEKTLSGHGSTQASTKVFSGALETFLHASRAQIFFDGPCGDFYWMKNVKLPDNCAYIGGDIVANMIAELQRKYAHPVRSLVNENASHPRRQFIIIDLAKDCFPAADVWLCKDCLQHLSNSEITRVLRNFARSKVEVALISNHIGVRCNSDIETGGFRYVDLTLPPFNLPPPRQRLPDAPIGGEARYVGVWSREDLVWFESRDRQEPTRSAIV
jgi:hypothetical protein